MIRVPNLYILGFQKCGSSSLFSLLESHPNILGSSPKETFFLTDITSEYYSFRNNIHNDKSSWNEFYKKDNYKTFNYVLEGSVNNFYQKTALEYIKKSSNAKVIFILRDPIERFKSNFKYFRDRLMIKGYDLNVNSYIDFVINKRGNMDDVDYALERGKYSIFIDKWRTDINDENILLLGFNDLAKNQEHLKYRIGDFLGLDSTKFIFPGVVNKSQNVRYKLFHKFLFNYIGGKSFLYKNYFRKVYRKYFFSTVVDTLSQDNKKRLREYYKVEYDRYSKYF